MDHPIIFSAPMICALLDGRKTMTRRMAWRTCPKCGGRNKLCDHCADVGQFPSPWQKVKPGDRLWCREAWRQAYPEGMGSHGVIYRADKIKALGMDEFSDRHKWKPSIHMPRWASRLTLVVTATKIEPVQAISEEDARAEGTQQCARRVVGLEGGCESHRCGFQQLWGMLHGAGAWDRNPEVVALTFTVHRQQIDQMQAAA